MIDPKHPVIRELVRQGYHISGHAYLKTGRLRFSYTARHENTGQVVQGWSRGGDAGDALNDLGVRAGLVHLVSTG